MLDREALERLAATCATRSTPGADDIETYLAAQVDDASHRDVVGPLLASSGASGVVRVGGREVRPVG